jgi:hypothetical protein
MSFRAVLGFLRGHCLVLTQTTSAELARSRSAGRTLLSSDPSWMEAILGYLRLVASTGSCGRGDDYVFSLLSSMACYCGVVVPTDWYWRPFQNVYDAFDPTIAQVMDCLCCAFGLHPEGPQPPFAAEPADITAALKALHLKTSTSFSLTGFIRQSPLGDLLLVNVSTGEILAFTYADRLRSLSASWSIQSMWRGNTSRTILLHMYDHSDTPAS